MRRSALIVLLMLTGCSEDSPAPPNIHDSKYQAVGPQGAVLPDWPASWECVVDQFTGLTWEVKTELEGLHDWRNTYTWHSPDEAHHELDYRGTANGGVCQGSDCDTHAWVIAVNEAGWCGFNDWRMPSKDELASISDPQRMARPPTINTQAFPYAQASEYWSGNDYSFQWDAAWVWSFEHGHDRVEWKSSPRQVRLVRGSGQQIDRVKD